MSPPVALLQVRNAGGVIAMVMGDENVAERPAGPVQSRFDRAGLWGINRGGGAARLVVDQDAVIVLQTGEQIGFCGHARQPTGEG